MAATVSSVSFDLCLGPLRSPSSPATPESASWASQRRTLAGFTPNACATSNWVAALIRVSDAAANRRVAESAASHAKARLPCTNTRPPSSSSTIAAAIPIGRAPSGTSGSGGCAVIAANDPRPPVSARIALSIIEHCERTRNRFEQEIRRSDTRNANQDRTHVRSPGVGVHRGLVYLDTTQDDVYGLAANLAARVSGLAPPGAVVVSDAVEVLIRND